MKQFSPEIVWRDIDTITPYHQNTKKHPDSQVEKIASSMSEFGVDQPLVLDGDGVIVKGHGRFSAAKRLGMQKVPVIVRTDLTPAQVKQARILDNKSNESEWDIDSLALEMSWLDEAGESTRLTGFSDEEFHDIINSCTPTNLDDIDNASEKPVPDSEDQDDWEKIHLKVLRDDKAYFDRLMATAPGQKPHEKFQALLSCFDENALRELARAEKGR